MLNKFVILTAMSTAAIILGSNAIFVMVFGSLGKISVNSGGNYVLVLYIILATTGITAYLSSFRISKYKLFRQTCLFISTILCGAILGFYYGGTVSNNNPLIATISALILAIVFGVLFWQKYRLTSVIVAFISALAAYGFSFWAGTQGIALMRVSLTSSGIIWSVVCLLYMGMAIANFMTGVYQIRVD